MILAVYKAARILKEDPGLNMVKIIKVILRDQVVYFIAYVSQFEFCRRSLSTNAIRLIFVSAATILAEFLSSIKPILAVEDSIGNPAILSSVSAHLLLNMKESGAKGLNEGMGAWGDTMDGMDFAAPPTQVSAQPRPMPHRSRLLRLTAYRHQ